MQLALGKKITLMNDKEIPTADLADADVNKYHTPRKPHAKPRIDMRKQLEELKEKFSNTVSQNQFTENIGKISDVFEKYSSKILEIDQFIGKIRSLSQPAEIGALTQPMVPSKKKIPSQSNIASTRMSTTRDSQ